MSSNREHRLRLHTSLYKKFLKKIEQKKKRNMALKNTNNELCRKVIQLRKEVREASRRNSSLKAEIYDLAMDRKNVMENNKRMFSTLASLHNDALTFEKRLDNILNDKNLQEFSGQFHDSQGSFSMPVVNGQLIKNPKDDIIQQRGMNYPRYNFKDCIYIQDLSPIMEENAEVKKLTKQPDITRRLGHRAKVQQPLLETVEMSGSLIDEAVEENLVNNSSWASSIAEHVQEMNKLENNCLSSELKTISNAIVDETEQFTSKGINNESNNISTNESVPNTSCLSEQFVGQQSPILSNEKEREIKISESPVLTINVLPQYDDIEQNHKDPNFCPSIFVNVFPRRRKKNDPGCSFSVGGTAAEESDCDRSQEPNSTSSDKEDFASKHCLPNISKSLVYQGCKSENDSLAKNSLTLNYEEINRLNSTLAGKSPEQSIISGSWIDSQKNVDGLDFFSSGENDNKKITSEATLERSLDFQSLEASSSKPPEKENGVDYKDVSTLLQSNDGQSSCSGQDTTLNSSTDKEIENEEKASTIFKRKSIESSSTESSPIKEDSPFLKQVNKRQSELRAQRSSVRISVQSPKSYRKESSLVSLQENRSLVTSASQKASGVILEKSSKRSIPCKRSSPRPSAVTDMKKTLRVKKPIKFVESPLIQKRRKKKTKHL